MSSAGGIDKRLPHASIHLRLTLAQRFCIPPIGRDLQHLGFHAGHIIRVQEGCSHTPTRPNQREVCNRALLALRDTHMITAPLASGQRRLGSWMHAAGHPLHCCAPSAEAVGPLVRWGPPLGKLLWAQPRSLLRRGQVLPRWLQTGLQGRPRWSCAGYH